MIENTIRIKYFEWIYDVMRGERFPPSVSHKKLFSKLHNTEFVYTLPMDDNRADDGINLRRKFALIVGDEDQYEMLINILRGPCTVLEMIAALALRCEETLMDDPEYGNRTGQWFWSMLGNLGLGIMHDDRYDEAVVDDILAKFLAREYEPNGKGGLFHLRHPFCDLRRVEIWSQLSMYINELEGF